MTFTPEKDKTPKRLALTHGYGHRKPRQHYAFKRGDQVLVTRTTYSPNWLPMP